MGIQWPAILVYIKDRNVVVSVSRKKVRCLEGVYCLPPHESPLSKKIVSLDDKAKEGITPEFVRSIRAARDVTSLDTDIPDAGESELQIADLEEVTIRNDDEMQLLQEATQSLVNERAEPTLVEQMKAQLSRLPVNTAKVKAIEDQGFVLDDIVGCKSLDIAHSPVIRWLYCSGRHIKASTLLCSQLGRVICNPTIRSQSDYVLTSSLASDQLDSVWRITSGLSWKEFLAKVHALDDYKFILYDSVIAKGNRWHEMKAPLAPKFKIEYKNHKAKKNDKKKDGSKKYEC